MPSNSTRSICLAVALSLTSNVAATPQVTFPINSQLPPVAYAFQPFEFSFSPSTFTSDALEVSYALSRQPAWLSLESSSRRLLGTPGSGDAGAPTFEIIASDNNGQVSSSVTLVVQQDQKLFPNNGDILSQLSNAGGVSAPSTLLLHPQQSFAFSLDPSLFNGSSTNTAFYAVSSDGSPLPSWIQFDSTSIRFTGTTPPSRAPEPSGQKFPFKLVASDVAGFSEASLIFDILVNDRILAFTHASFNFTIWRGSSLQTQSLLQYVTIDGVVAARDQLTFANVNLPSWLHLNESTLSLFGNVPDKFDSSTFLISVGAVGTNVANVSLSLQVLGQQNGSQTDLGIVYVVGGTYLVYKVIPPTVFSNNENVTVRTTGIPSWLLLTQSNTTLHGLVPENITATEFQISLIFSDADKSVDANLTIAYASTANSPNNTGTVTSTETPITGSNTSTTHTSSGPKTSTLVLSIALPILGLIALICVLIIWIWGPKKRQKQQPAMAENTFSSQPPLQETGSETGGILSIPGSVQPYKSIPEATDSAPQVELPWAPDSLRRSRDRLFKKARASQGSAIGSSWDDLIEYRSESKDDLPPMPVATFRPRKDSGVPISMISQPLRIPPKRPPRPPSPGMPLLFTKLCASNSQVPASQVTGLSRRLSGVGHGSGRGWNADQGNPRSSWQTTFSTIPMVESRPSVIMLGSFPAPPSNNSLGDMSGTHGNLPQPKPNPEPKLRLVQSSSSDSGSSETAARMGHNTTTKAETEGLARSSNPDPLQKVVPITEHEDWQTYEMPPLPQRSHARPRGNSPPDQEKRFQYSQGKTELGRELGRELSAASSRQFDSAISSDSQWEDDNSKANSNDEEKEQWRTIGSTSSSKPPPRLIDQRKQVSIEQSNLDRSQRSHKGSLRFI